MTRPDKPTIARPSTRTLDTAALAHWLAPALGATAADITAAECLPGGAVQENWRLAVTLDGGQHAGNHTLALRKDAPAQTGYSLDRATEAAVLEAAAAAGVTVAAPLARCEDMSLIGSPFLIQRFVTGTAQGRRIARDPDLPSYGGALAARLGTEMARIHAIAPPHPSLGTLPGPTAGQTGAATAVAGLRSALDGATEARPALEFILRWLDRHQPDPNPIGLVHGDFRTGNYMVDAGELTAILDWEFAHWGDPDEDIGWFTARCWRFGNDDREAGGIGSLDAFLDAYEAQSGRRVDRDALPFWQIMALAKWATIAVLQGDRYRKGGEDSIEAALTGLMAPELELEALDAVLASGVRKM
jgi:aminoglycoside phosphotransferase (APT) family kinase protein